ncbi:endonuclease/exonuclease/phosphatase family protein [Clostridium sp. BJN0001]|uniref:endonuclease/exonuclease/phosphatase family protein n=1 Tax=Clostridium sp. BJN0001 TaxID=2930219 RepID=UPI001FD3D3A3|nr:endonuclease/exonuclease/phosphatase family protein [Clostridium sp. BJN0001]
MKIMTLNTHSLVEGNDKETLIESAEAIIKEDFDIISLQEVNQSISANPILKDDERLKYFISADDTVVIKEDNYVLRLAEELLKQGRKYYWSWVPSHIGYDKYDEGIAILSKTPILEADGIFISNIREYSNYRTRRILKVKSRVNGEIKNFFSLHFGWWNDKDEPFKNQWETFYENAKKIENEPIYIMGDFNIPADNKNEGYDLIKSENYFKDTYVLAENHDEGYTVEEEIDGWRNSDKKSRMRIDYIFKNSEDSVKESSVIFNDKKYKKVSDHFGLMIEE